MRKIEKWFKTNWLEVFYFVFAVLALLFLLWYGLARILPEITVAEAKQAASSASTKTIIENPLGLPHKVLQHISQKTSAWCIRNTFSKYYIWFSCCCFILPYNQEFVCRTGSIIRYFSFCYFRVVS